MIENFRVYLPKSKREVKIQISSPRHKDNIIFDTVYFLDGQNAFSDYVSAFGRSIRATKHIYMAAKNMGKRIIGVAVFNSGSDMGRVNEYSPWKMVNPLIPEWSNSDPKICMNYHYDFIHTIIPFIESKYNVSNNRAIYGSSLGAVMAAYMCFKDDVFNSCGLYSLANFLFEPNFSDFVKENIENIKKKRVFIYVGKEEQSDDRDTKEIFLHSALDLNKLLSDNDVKTRLVISYYGSHNEETWDHNFFDFLTFIYYDNIIYKY